MRNKTLSSILLIVVLCMAAFGVAAQDQIDITIAGWSSNPAEDAALQARLDAFMAENPNISVAFVPSSVAAWSEPMTSACGCRRETARALSAASRSASASGGSPGRGDSSTSGASTANGKPSRDSNSRR